MPTEKNNKKKTFILKIIYTHTPQTALPVGLMLIYFFIFCMQNSIFSL